MLRLFHDEDSQQTALLSALRRAGFDCLTANEAGMRSQTDESQLAFAAAEARVLYSRNVKDFQRLHKEWLEAGRSHSGIVVLGRRQLSIGAQMQAFVRISESLGPEVMSNQLLYLLNYA